MKCCLDYRQIDTYLQKADEIKIPYIHYDKCAEFFEKYPNKDIVLQIILEDPKIDWSEIEKINVLSKGHLILCLPTEEDCIYAQTQNYRFYYHYPICTYFDFNNFIKKCTPEYVILGAPLFFDFPYVQQYCKSIRAIPNIANYTPFNGLEDNIFGTWIRPEDLDHYGRFVKCIEFVYQTLDQEQALYRIYMQDKKFSGPLGLIVKDLNNENVQNSLIPSKLSIKRFACQQMCQRNGRCQICKRLASITNYDAFKRFAEFNGIDIQFEKK